MEETELQNLVRKAATEIFAREGLKFTMQDVAEQMHISKKTIYTAYSSKEELLEAMLEGGFQEIRIAKDKILRDETLTPKEKLRSMMIALPEEYEWIDFRRLKGLGEKYPKVQKHLENQLMTGWEPTLLLIEEGKRDGWIRKDLNVKILQIIFVASIERFLQGEGNTANYSDSLRDMIQILTEGICI